MPLQFRHDDATVVERRDIRDPGTGEVKDTLLIGTTLQSDALLPGYDSARIEALTDAAVEHWKATNTAYDTITVVDMHVPIGALDYGLDLDDLPGRAWIEFYGGRLSITYADRSAAAAVMNACDANSPTSRPERPVDYVRSNWIGAGHRLVSAERIDTGYRKAVVFKTEDRRKFEVSSRHYDHDAIMRWVGRYVGYDGPPLPDE